MAARPRLHSVLLAAAVASGAAAEVTLREAAKARGLFVGAAGNTGHLKGDAEYAAVLAKQYNLVTAENGCKWGAVRPSEDVYDYSQCDYVADFAAKSGLTFRGHNLCWGSYNPQWLTSGRFSADKLRQLLLDHISNVTKYYGKAAYGWDVVNEAVADQGGVLKPTVWYPAVPDYIDLAFKAARAAAPPGVKLFYNDYNIASMSEDAVERHPHTGELLFAGSADKSDAVYKLLKAMRARGVPLDGIGMQVHINVDYSSFDGVAANMKRLADLGLEIHVTEMDVACAAPCDEAKQANVYRALLEVCLKEAACKNFETWGFTDKYTWKGTDMHPLPFDEMLKPKPAVAAMLAALQATGDVALIL